MATQVIYVARYSDDQIEVSEYLPKPRRSKDFPDSTFPITQGYRLSRLLVEADHFPVMPEGDQTEAQYRDWLAILAPYTEEEVDRHLVAVDAGGLFLPPPSASR